MADDTAKLIADEVRRIIENAHGQAEGLLKKNSKILHKMAEALIRFETIDSDQIDQLMAGEEPDPPEGWNEDSKKKTKPKSESRSKDSAIGCPAEQV